MWPLATHIVLDSKEAKAAAAEINNIVKNIVVIVMTIYISIAVRNNMHFVLCRYCCGGRYSINFDLKCLEKSGNLFMTGEWPPDHNLFCCSTEIIHPIQVS